jgi:mannose-6-phosphate isomerase
MVGRLMTKLHLTQPLVFEPIFMERVWGGRRLESLYGKALPNGIRIGESWEMVDRPEAQSVVHEGPLRGKTLHDLWTNHRAEIFGMETEDFGESPKSARESRALPERFPILAKLLDAQENLSLQVHPPPEIAAELKGEPKSELWYVADASPGARLFAGLKKGSSRAAFEQASKGEEVEQHLHSIALTTGDAIFLPSGRLHALGSGNVIVEIQQNSDTTYRVYDWDRVRKGGAARTMHLEEALQCIDFADVEPSLLKPDGEALVRQEFFEVAKWSLAGAREIAPRGGFAIVVCLTGALECAGLEFKPGDFFLVPAEMPERTVKPIGENVSLLRVTIPRS